MPWDRTSPLFSRSGPWKQNDCGSTSPKMSPTTFQTALNVRAALQSGPDLLHMATPPPSSEAQTCAEPGRSVPCIILSPHVCQLHTYGSGAVQYCEECRVFSLLGKEACFPAAGLPRTCSEPLASSFPSPGLPPSSGGSAWDPHQDPSALSRWLSRRSS